MAAKNIRLYMNGLLGNHEKVAPKEIVIGSPKIVEADIPTNGKQQPYTKNCNNLFLYSQHSLPTKYQIIGELN